jgi:uncharacterized protein
MSRLLFWIAIVILVVMAVRSKLRAFLNDGQATAPAPDAGARPRADNAPVQVEAAERMLSCAACGLHFPASEAVVADGREYCCAAHAQARSR